LNLPFDEYRKVLSVVPIVCVDCLVVNDAGEYLLVKRRNEPLKGEFWVPGGRLYKNERLAGAVQRKMKEEIGVEVEIIRSIGFFEEFFDRNAENAEGGTHSISLVYLVRPKSLDIKLDDQSAEWGWFKKLPECLLQYANLNVPQT
jgi:colanic acid biosynthesis protein WcaH